MTIRVVKHQLQAVEQLMGLPAQYRLWGRKEACVGVLRHDSSSVFAKAVMGQTQETLRSLKQTICCIQLAAEDSGET